MSAATRRNWRGMLLLGAKVAFSVGLMAFLFSRIPAVQVGEVLRHADRRWLATAAGLMLASNLLGAWQWARLLGAVGIRIPLWKVVSYYHVGLFFNNFLPANIGGDFMRVMDVSRHDRSRASALSTVLMDRLIGTVALAGLALVTTLPAIDRFHLTLAYLALVGFFGISVVMVWAVFHPALLPAIERMLARVGLSGLKGPLDDLAARLGEYRKQRRLILQLLLLAGVVQMSRIAVHALVARALGLTIPFSYFLLFVPLLAVIVSLPISLNGIGVREGAGIVLFGLVGVDRTAAFSLQFTTYLVAVAVSLLGGLTFLARIPIRRATTHTERRLS
jgi:uncharacterized protein (TIRG00374 family)